MCGIAKDQVGAFFRHHDGWRIGVARRDGWKDRSVDDAQPVNAMDPQFMIHHIVLLVWPHAAGADGMKHARCALPHVVGQFCVRLHRRAEARAAALVDRLERVGVHAEGRVGDADPLLAIADALPTFPADEIVIAAEAERADQLLARAHDRFALPVFRAGESLPRAA